MGSQQPLSGGSGEIFRHPEAWLSHRERELRGLFGIQVSAGPKDSLPLPVAESYLAGHRVFKA